jgi:hypothetical protein
LLAGRPSASWPCRQPCRQPCRPACMLPLVRQASAPALAASRRQRCRRAGGAAPAARSRRLPCHRALRPSPSPTWSGLAGWPWPCCWLQLLAAALVALAHGRACGGLACHRAPLPPRRPPPPPPLPPAVAKMARLRKELDEMDPDEREAALLRKRDACLIRYESSACECGRCASAPLQQRGRRPERGDSRCCCALPCIKSPAAPT